MSSVVEVWDRVYSPVCDTDAVAYIRCLDFVADVFTVFAGKSVGGSAEAGAIEWLESRYRGGVGRIGGSVECVAGDVSFGALAGGSDGKVDGSAAEGGERGGREFGTKGLDGQEVDEDKASVAGLGQFDKPVAGGCGRRAVRGDVSSSGGEAPCVGAVEVSAKTLENRRRRWERKERKKARQAGMSRASWRSVDTVSVGVPAQLSDSWVARKNAENAVAEEKAKRELVLLRAQDVGALKELQRTRVLKGTEKNLVAVEQAYNALKRAGDVPGFVPGSCETVVGSAVPTLSSSVSPSSSASNASYLALKKKNDDLEEELARLKDVNREHALKRLVDGETVAFTAKNVSEGLLSEIGDICNGGFTREECAGDDDTVYIKAYDETKSWAQVLAGRKNRKTKNKK